MPYQSFNPYQYSFGQSPLFNVPQQSQQYQQSQAPAPQMQQTDGVRWVQGEAGAKASPVAPGHMAVLMDSEDSVFYMKAVDPYGIPQPLRKFRFTEEVIEEPRKNLPQNSTQMDPSNYITKEEFDQKLKEKLEELMK